MRAVDSSPALIVRCTECWRGDRRRRTYGRRAVCRPTSRATTSARSTSRRRSQRCGCLLLSGHFCQSHSHSYTLQAWKSKRYAGDAIELASKDLGGTFDLSTTVEVFIAEFATDLKDSRFKAIGCAVDPPFASVFLGEIDDAIPDYTTDGAPPIDPSAPQPDSDGPGVAGK